MISFTVDAVPIPQPRQRHRVAYIGDRAVSRNYTPSDHPVVDFKAMVKLSFPRDTEPFLCPVQLSAVFVMPRPKAKQWKRKETPRYDHAVKPDLDNLLKSLKDALQGVAWRDDSQVCVIDAVKVVASGDEQPHVEVMIEGRP